MRVKLEFRRGRKNIGERREKFVNKAASKLGSSRDNDATSKVCIRTLKIDNKN
jgi:hypothetical protein